MADLDFTRLRAADFMMAIIALREMAKARRAEAAGLAESDPARKMLEGNAAALDSAADRFNIARARARAQPGSQS